MDNQTFLNEFGYLIEVPNGIQKLRQLILQLAVRGKLISQSPNDEPAEKILKKIRDCIKPITDNEKPYTLPNGWTWLRIGDYLDFQYGKALPEKERDAFGSIDVFGSNGIVGKHSKYLTKEPCIIIGRKGSAGALNITYKASWTIDVAYYLIPPIGFDLNFTYILLKAVKLEDLGKGIKPGINRNQAYDVVCCLPPLEEQKRIVEKVDQLMALCDQLEAQQQDKKQLRVIMNTASLQTLTKTQTQPEIHHAWQRIKDHFGSLYDTPETIPQLRQAILQFAVQGKLLPQDPNDEPAQSILNRLTIQKQKDLKITKPSTPIAKEEMEHFIPDNWTWARLSDITELITDGTHQTPKYTTDGRMFLSAQNVKPFKFMPENHKFVSEEDYQSYIKSKKPEYEDILLTRVGAGIGEAAVINQDLDFAIYVSLGLIRPCKKYINPYYLTLWLNSPSGTSKSLKYTYGRGVSQGNLNLSLIRNFVVPIPPYEEQKRIIEKVNQLMVLCDQLEAQLKQAEADASLLLQAMIQRLIEGTPASSEATQISNINVSNLTDATKQAAVVTYIVSHLRNDASLGDLKVAKILFLIQEHIDIPLGYQYTKPVKVQLQLQSIDSGAEYQKWAAGPFDKALYTETQPEGERKQWFVTEKRPGGGHRYKLAQKAQEGFEMGKAILQPKMAEIDALMKPLAKLQTDDIEIVTTLYAAWKELIQKEANRNKDSVLKGFYAWSEKKKQYAPGVVEQWLGWMQDYGITPEPINVLTGATV